MNKLIITILLVIPVVFQGFGQDKDEKRKGLTRIGGGSFDDDVTVIVNGAVIKSLSGLESLSELSELSHLSELSQLADINIAIADDFDFDFDFGFDENIVIKIDEEVDLAFDFDSFDAIDVINDIDISEIINQALDQQQFRKNKIRE